MSLAEGPQRSDAGEARTRGPSVTSQALYNWGTALPIAIFAPTEKNNGLSQKNVYTIHMSS